MPPVISLGYHLVLYLDLLGQSNELQKIRALPETEEERAATWKVIQQSALRVFEIRSHFASIVTNLRTDSEAVERMPEAVRDSFMRLRNFELKYVGFSDSFVISVPLTDRGEAEGIGRAAATVWAVLAATAMVSLTAMSRGIPLRGGITVGTAVDLFENEAYGAALVDAYRLESEQAEYNRVLVGVGLFEYLEHLKRRPLNNAFDRGAQTSAQRCSELICWVPDDGLPMVHALSPFVMALPTSDGTTWEELRAPAKSWVTSEAQRFANERNYKMWSRYVRLLRYFEAFEPEKPSNPETQTNRGPPRTQT